MRPTESFLLAAACLVLAVPPAAAQSEPPAGVRAAGMGGAFVAVSDDASAVYWNPAGLASGSFFSLVLDRNALKPDDALVPRDRSTLLFALATPALGLSYYRTAAPAVPIVEPGVGRNIKRSERLIAQHFGVTLVQSVGGGVAVGATIKAVHGRTDAESKTTVDADVGVLASGALGRIGLAVRNLLQPEFQGESGRIRLDRRVRGGASLLIRQQVTLAFDADFTTADTAVGRWRDAAVGGELHPLPRAWARAGLHWNTAGGDDGPGAAPVGSVGASVAVSGGLMADGQVTFGSKNGNRGWGVGLRFAY